MALKNYKVNESIDVTYQATGSHTAIVVTMDVYDEANVKDVAQSGTMLEVGTTGRYKKSFTPNAEGNWTTMISDTKGGKAVASYSVGQFNIGTVGANVASLQADVTTISGKIDDLATAVSDILSPPMIG
jgi:hypothetical protein